MPSRDLSKVVESMNPPETIDLASCPFCGNTFLIGVSQERVSELFSVTCNACGAEGPAEKLKESAIKKWNIRDGV